jgi:hypothetical protein
MGWDSIACAGCRDSNPGPHPGYSGLFLRNSGMGAKMCPIAEFSSFGRTAGS